MPMKQQLVFLLPIVLICAGCGKNKEEVKKAPKGYPGL